MGRKSIPFDRAHNATQLAAELRAAGLDAPQVSNEGSNRFWVNYSDSDDVDTINQVVADHAPVVDAGMQAALDLKQDAITPGANIPDPTGAVTDQDDEARTAIGLILDLLEAKGLMAPAEEE